jgi:orotate phosphoribosyltransferase
MGRALTLDSTILDYLRRDELLGEGHFAFRSGRHSAILLDRDRLLADPVAASRMGYALAKRFFTDHVATVASPSIWGAGLAQWVAYFLDPRAKVVYATRRDDRLTIADNLAGLIEGQRVLLIDNLVISGETLGAFAAMVEAMGAEIVGLGTLWNSAEPVMAGLPVFGLLNTRFEAYRPEACPLCAAGREPVEPAGY